MKSIYSLFLKKIITIPFVLCSFSALAQQPSNCPASPYPINVKQADGSTLTIVGKGGMLNSWTETTDGYSIVKKNGIYEYATKVSGKLVATGVAAKNLRERKSTETEFLKKQPKSLSPDRPALSKNPAFPSGTLSKS
ncbi:MAG: hypothetical protein M3142_08410, partial [Bacteroidota bacterium]|nr:hypothetical protein [Bacteroidota bacterium]